jgi:2-oxo-4-hydroxy-4-carboxy-5-ureidoimidazoline decarboxylase
MDLDRFNEAPDPEVTQALAACCDVPTWVDAVRAQRPNVDTEQLLDVADTSARTFTRADVDRALAQHPRIGERAAGAGTEAAWSRQEQAAARTEDDAVQRELLAGNRAYEERFGRVFLICATGLSAGQILAALHERLRHDEDTEAAVVADELRKIALLRLRKLVEAR